MENLKTKSIGEFVSDDYRTAAVFQKYKIDFCCKGNKTIEEVCESKNISADELITKLSDASKKTDDRAIDYQSWPLDLLANYIEKIHHRYIADKTPALKNFLDKLCKVHGKNHPELFEISKQFYASADELAAHMKKEEQLLFPYIKKMAEAKQKGEPIKQPDFGVVKNPIEMMMKEHEIEGDRFRQISLLSNSYIPPPDACSTYKVTFELLKEFEDDLHLHIHLENNILFPGIIELENELVNELTIMACDFEGK